MQEDRNGTSTIRPLSELLKELGHIEHFPSESEPTGNYYQSDRYREALQRKVDYYNSTAGALTGANCSKCNNKGVFMFINDDMVETCRTCECMAIRQCANAMKQSGIDESVLERMTFEAFTTEEEWQKRMKLIAMKYTEAVKNGDTEHWLFMSGQSGSGKTHLSTAVCVELMKAGHKVKYMTWHEIVHKLQQAKFNEERYNAVMSSINDSEILYIDDLFKTEKSERDIAFEVLNSRYISKKPTVISCELNMPSIIEIDVATAGRIEHMSKGFSAQIINDEKRNYRRK